MPELDRHDRSAHHTRPVLFCSKWDPTPGLPCVERRYAFEVEWSDARALDEALVEQLRTRHIVSESYKCVPNPSPEPALKGRSVADVLATMGADRFACALEYRALDAELDRKPRAGQPARAVIVSCSRWDPSPERACIEERVVYEVEWPDPVGDPLDQLATAMVIGQTFRCAPNWNREPARPGSDR